MPDAVKVEDAVEIWPVARRVEHHLDIPTLERESI
jgi:hypothetical protein